jgi:chromosome segregation protein
MLIKKVIVQGFKTFASRTEFVFDPGITAVVGPNGSGKSNIVDAVRWCLGEQSFSLLRSKKTSDIIFSGSDKRPRLGMASVSLTLDNSSGEIPIDYIEVEITRRAYRDGENEYLVNGQKVRLQDVAEMLAQTGLGKRTYSVIGQGLIDRALSLAPEERRSLFEEAAGITGYQAKRETALRRLDITEHNLTRVRDITTELAPRLSYLRRQAERAMERAQVAADLRDLLREWYGFRWHTSLAEMERAHGAAAQLQESVAIRQQALHELARQIEAVRSEQATRRSALAEQHRTGSELHKRAEGIDRELAVTQERLRQTQERHEEATRELALLRTQAETIADRAQELNGSLADLRRLHHTRQAEVRVVETSVTALQQGRARLLTEIDQARRNVEELARRQADARGRLSQAQERQITLGREIEAQVEKQERAQFQAQVARQAVEATEAQHRLLEEEAAELQKTIDQLESAHSGLRVQLNSADEDRRAAERAADRLQTRFDLLRRLRDEGAGFAAGVRAVLQAALPNVLGPVAGLLHVPPHLDKAIETALGGALQNLVTERWEDAQAAIEFLKRNNRGRATFLPLDRLHIPSPIAAPAMPGVLGNAFDLVRFDPRAGEAMRQLLNRIWVVETLPAARAALDALRDGVRPTVVTLEGEIVRPGGAVTGGSDGERRDDSVLARARELRELPEQIAAALRRVQEAGSAFQEIALRIASAQAEMDAGRQRLAECARRERAQRQQLEDARRSADLAQQSARWEEERAEGQRRELGELERRSQELADLLQALIEEHGVAVAALGRTEEELVAMGGDDLLRELAERRTAEVEARSRLTGQEQLVQEQEKTLRGILEQVHLKEVRVATLLGEGERLAEEVRRLAEQDAELSAAIQALQRLIQPEGERLAALDAAQREIEERERAMQQALRWDESAWSHAQLALQRSEDAVHQLRTEILHDLGLVNMEQSDEVATQPPLPLDAFVDQLPVVESVGEGLEGEVRETRARLSRLSNVNPDAPKEYEDAASRYEYLLIQSDDLEAAAADLRKVIRELDETMKGELTKTFNAIALHFREEFQRLFNGGSAELVLSDENDIANSGIEILVRPPGKRPQSLALLSGGERALTACALIFAILRVSPTPFCVLDEVDAALDEANVDRFRLAVEALSQDTQFIIVTHNRRTLEGANTIYGVTMGQDGVSKVISLRLDGDEIIHHHNGAGPTALVGEVEEPVRM